MPFILELEIHGEELIEGYSKILKAKGNQSKVTFATSEMEQMFARTIFKGTTVKPSPGGVSAPDWFVTNQGIIALMKKVAGPEILNTQRFTQWAKQAYQDSISIEGKFLRSQKDKNVDVADLRLTGEDYKTDSFSLAKDSVIDSTKHSILQSLRTEWSKENEAYLEKGIDFTGPTTGLSELSTKRINKASLSDFNKKLGEINRDMQAFLNSDVTFTNLRTLMQKSFEGKEDIGTAENKSRIETWVNTINNRYVRSGFIREINLIQRDEDKLFNYITSVPEIKDQFYQKSRNIAIFRNEDGKPVTGLLLTFKPNEFTSKFFGAKFDISTGALSVYIKSDIEKTFLSELSSSATKLVYDGSQKNYEKAVEDLITKGQIVTTGDFSYFSKSLELKVPTGGSIPMSRAYLKFSDNMQIVDPVKFITPQSASQTNTAQSTQKMGNFLSSEYLRMLIIKKVVSKMPLGAIGGRTTVSDILTFRTGRFANSIDVLVNYRTQMIQYYYNPIYYVHEKTDRDPRRLISESIAEVMQANFKQQFKISEVGIF